MPARIRPLLASLLLAFACSSPPASAPAEKAPKDDGTKVAAATPAPRAEPAGPSAEELKEVLEPAKVAARQTCRAVSRGGERVEVELTIAGSSGAVSHTSVGQDGGNPGLANCVAGELGRVKFKPNERTSTRTPVAIQF